MYRPELDGIRAIAVIGLLLYHSNHLLPGGYICVDVFFILSGFLITSIIRKEIEYDAFSLMRFWERRIRRLFPAMFFMMLVIAPFFYYVMSSDDLIRLGKSTIAQSLLFSNIYFWRSINYFTDTATGVPLLHTWSLSLEEQFYFLFPLSLLLIKGCSAKTIRIVLLIVAFLSLILSIVGTALRSNGVYYLLPARAWELLAGALLAYADIEFLFRIRHRIRIAASWIGIGMIVFACFAYSDKTPFPGVAALLPCLGTVLAVAGIAHKDQGARPLLVRLLSVKPLTVIGKASYAIYLWHMPVIAWAIYRRGPIISPGDWLAVYCLIFLVAGFSTRWIESPIRKGIIFPRRRQIIAFAAFGTIVMLGVGSILYKVIPSPFVKEESIINLYAKKHVSEKVDSSPSDVAEDKCYHMVEGKNGDINILLWGDSHARFMIPALTEYLKTLGISGAAITYSAALPFADYNTTNIHTRRINTRKWVEETIRYIRRHRIRNVILAGNWDSVVKEVGVNHFRMIVINLISELQGAGTSICFTLDIPTYRVSVPVRLVREAISGRIDYSWRLTPSDYEKQNRGILNLALELQKQRVTILDPRPYLLDMKSGYFKVDSQKHAMYYDSHHLTDAASIDVFTQVFKNNFPAVLQNSK